MVNLWRSLCKYVALTQDQSRTRPCLWVTILLHRTMILLLSQRHGWGHLWTRNALSSWSLLDIAWNMYPDPVVEREVVWLYYASLLYHSTFSAPVLLAIIQTLNTWTVFWIRERWRCVWLSWNRPPPSKDNCSTIPDFLDQWSTFLSGYTTNNNAIIIVGDLNFHVDVKNDRDAQRFMDTIKACGLQQHVHEPTHLLGQTLDVVISRDTSHIISAVTITDPGLCNHFGKLTLDHFVVTFTTTLVTCRRLFHIENYVP